ncbi:MAG: hypothetical protein JWR19_2598, partial [Pedosphaera sp.]|nr:hypothetical protein [Pedosphaera sp.]
MKSFNFIQRLLTLAALGSALAGAPAFAQMPGGASSSMNSAMIKLFGNNTSFISKAELRVLDKSQKETTSLPLVFNMLDGKVRMEMDMN